MAGPSPAYRPDFPRAFVQAAQQMVAKRTGAYQLRQRAELVVLLHAHPPSSHVAAGAEVCLTPTLFAIGATVGPMASLPLQSRRAGGTSPIFPPLDKAIVKAIACEAVYQTGLPVSRLSTADLTAQARRALSKPISPSTVWRMLDADAIKPWRYKYWLFPRDPQFAEKAGRVLDLVGGDLRGASGGPRLYHQC